MTKLFVPGPVDVNPQILVAQTQPMLPHRSQEFEALFFRAAEKARLLFYTQYRVFLTASSGTGLQEAAVRSLAKERLLSCVNGAFSQRWYDVALANGKQVDKLDTEWNQPVSPTAVAEALHHKQYELITIVHNETSTGVQNPVAATFSTLRQVSPPWFSLTRQHTRNSTRNCPFQPSVQIPCA